MTEALTAARNPGVGNTIEVAGGRQGTDMPAGSVELRRFPYPYRAMLAICSDLDETPDRELYVDTARFLNSTATTRFGIGLGLEVGNTMYFDMPANQFSYWNADDRGRAEICELMRSGHIDCLHSFGDLAATRAHAARALEELSRHECRLDVWIDHAVAPSNFGADIMRGQGDVPGAPAYHADLTTAFGVKYVWRGRVTSVIAQGVPRSLRGIFRPAHPVGSALTLAREATKGILAGAGNRKYALHADNRLIEASHLRDGRPVIEFMRTNPHWGGVSSAETADGIGDVLVPSVLERLIERGGAAILYTHLGKTRDVAKPFSDAGLASLRRLSEADRAGDILVTTTRRLLGHSDITARLQWNARQYSDGLNVELMTGNAAFPKSDLDGLTFYVPEPRRTRLSIDGVVQSNLQHNPPDDTGRHSVSLPWRRLTFPSLS